MLYLQRFFPFFLDILHPFWQRAPLWLRRSLIWKGTSKFLVGVSAVCLNEKGQMLLLRHRFHNEYPWGFPGGWMDRGEAPEQTLRREIEEETGLRPAVFELIAVDGDGEWVNIYYLCRVTGNVLHLQESEMTDYRWVDPARLPVPLIARQAMVVAQVVERLQRLQ